MVAVISFLCETETGKNGKMEWGISEKGRKREQEKWIKRVEGSVKVRIKSSVD
jgi:hypothetical protein